ncbi:SgcJ/EcaC family oxidoreductase [Panacibacter sp. DH6]|uniref:SgcJ/EcaC family oxidoreductase n=1 Tax=Panacibacter microcysteis TaxID=2793269 RepID=A0A931GZN2_9BACT|nr:SgcJ/EcaC family oxidoreductase [Panacibacter microcysteis]MBG9378282.1 SgcJ/EcaC family oxidoreductase [Panacibacter microcysteis]
MNLAIPPTNHTYALYAITLGDYVENAAEKQIRQVFDHMKQAWANADAASFGECFTEDSDFVSFRGEHYKGKASNIAAHEKSFSGMLKNSSLYINIKSIRFLNETMAVVHAEGTVLKEYETATNCKLSYTTNILIKENGVWKITSFHNSKKHRKGLFSRLLGI